MNAPDEVGDLHLNAVSKRFGDFVAVDDLQLVVPQGSFFALLGPSGCGKTTTLRMVAGLEEPSEGTIHLGDLDIYENVAFGLRRRGVKDVRRQVDDALALVQLGHLARRKPAQLSGGQQQRIALARAIVNRPRVLLLDEPLGALDLKLRRQMQIELKRIQTEVGITFVHVTHDQEEAMTMADTVAVMNAGRIEQLGSPAELYEAPRTTFVANFLGQSNLVASRRVEGGRGDIVVVDCYGQKVAVRGDRCVAADDVLMGIRPEKVHLLSASRPASPGDNVLTGGVVADASFTGVSTQYLVRLPWGQELTVFVQNLGVGERFAPGDQVQLAWDPAHTFGLAGDAAAGVESDVVPVAS